jgi:hypothetical protein
VLDRQQTDLTNAQLAELLARQAEEARPPLTRALRRASRRAFLWPEEAASLQMRGRSLTELQGIGPYLEKLIRTWMDDASVTSSLSPRAMSCWNGLVAFAQRLTKRKRLHHHDVGGFSGIAAV